MPLIGISASNNNYRNPAKKAASNYKGYLANGSSLQSLTILRGDICGIDNNKAMYPLARVPVIGYIAHHAELQNKPVKIVGDSQTSDFTEFLNDLWGTDIEFVDEGKHLSLSNSIYCLFNDSIYDWNILVMSDVPMVRDYANHDHTGDIVICYNAERLTSGLNIKRNFYTLGSDETETQWFKEPNLFFFRKKGLSVVFDASNDMYKFRKAGGLPIGLTYHFAKRSWQDPSFGRKLWHYKKELYNEIRKTHEHKKNKVDAVPVDFKKFSRIIKDLYGIHLELTFSHNDIFRLLDMDGLNNDWVMYEHLMQKLFSQGKMHPRLVQLREAMKTEKHRFPIVNDFHGLAMEYLSQVNHHLPKKHRLHTSIDDLLDHKELMLVADELADLVPEHQ